MGEIHREEFFVETNTGMKLMVAARIPRTGRLGQAVLLVHGSGVGWHYWDIPIPGYSVMDYLAGGGVFHVEETGISFRFFTLEHCRAHECDHKDKESQDAHHTVIL